MKSLLYTDYICLPSHTNYSLPQNQMSHRSLNNPRKAKFDMTIAGDAVTNSNTIFVYQDQICSLEIDHVKCMKYGPYNPLTTTPVNSSIFSSNFVSIHCTGNQCPQPTLTHCPKGIPSILITPALLFSFHSNPNQTRQNCPSFLAMLSPVISSGYSFCTLFLFCPSFSQLAPASSYP